MRRMPHTLTHNTVDKNMKRKIKWEKWSDPLMSDINNDANSQEGNIGNNPDNNIIGGNIQKILHTPFGFISAMDNVFAANEFDFWILHTNFDITKKIAIDIEGTGGVETLEIYTRYRARIGFPKSGLFDIEKVKKKIEDKICQYDNSKINMMLENIPEQIKSKVVEYCERINNNYENWAVWMLPNGNIEAIGSDELDNIYKEKNEIFNYGYQMVGGRLITSEIING